MWHFEACCDLVVIGCLVLGTYPVQTKFWYKPRANLLKNISKNPEKNHECASQLTSSIYKILWSNSSYPRSYEKDKFGVHLNHYCLSENLSFCNF